MVVIYYRYTRRFANLYDIKVVHFEEASEKKDRKWKYRYRTHSRYSFTKLGQKTKFNEDLSEGWVADDYPHSFG